MTANKYTIPPSGKTAYMSGCMQLTVKQIMELSDEDIEAMYPFRSPMMDNDDAKYNEIQKGMIERAKAFRGSIRIDSLTKPNEYPDNKKIIIFP